MSEPVDVRPVARSIRIQFIALFGIAVMGWVFEDYRSMWTGMICGGIWGMFILQTQDWWNAD